MADAASEREQRLCWHTTIACGVPPGGARAAARKMRMLAEPIQRRGEHVTSGTARDMSSLHSSTSGIERREEPSSHSLPWPVRRRMARSGATETYGARAHVLPLPDVVIACCLGVVVLAVTCVINLNVIAQVPTSGDEPWYLLLGYSILHNHTVDLAAVLHNHTVYNSFLGGVADDHTADPLRNGVRVLPNLPGYPALVGLVYAWQGRSGVVVMQAGFAALTAILLYVVARPLLRSRLAGIFAALGMVGVAPALLYVSQIFPSIVAAAFVFLGFVAVAHWIPEAEGRRLVAAVGALAIAVLVLPWLHFRYVLASLALVALGTAALHWRGRVGRDRRRIRACLISVLALAGLNLGGVAWYCQHYFGTWTPPVNITRGTTLGLFHPDVARGLAIFYVTLLNPQAGLLPWAPLLLLSPVGLLLMWRRDRWAAVCVVSLFLGLMVTLASAFWSDQVYQGYAFPGRFAIEAVPLLSLAAAAVFAWPLERIDRPSGLRAATRAWLRMAPRPAAGVDAVRASQRGGMRRWSATAACSRVGALALALACIVLLAGSAWFGVAASRTAYLLYYSPAGTREAYRHPRLLPGWWFQAFPDVGEGFWNAPLPTSGIPFGHATALANGAGTVRTSDALDLAPGQYIARFTFACAPGSGDGAGGSATVAPAVARRVGADPAHTRLIQIAGQTLHDVTCGGRGRTATTEVSFGSDGYEPTVFRITSSAETQLVDVTVSFRHASAG